MLTELAELIDFGAGGNLHVLRTDMLSEAAMSELLLLLLSLFWNAATYPLRAAISACAFSSFRRLNAISLSK